MHQAQLHHHMGSGSAGGRTYANTLDERRPIGTSSKSGAPLPANRGGGSGFRRSTCTRQPGGGSLGETPPQRNDAVLETQRRPNGSNPKDTAWLPLDRSRKNLPQLKLLQNWRSSSIFELRQSLEDWLNKSTFAIATWRGDAQAYWLEEVVERARVSPMKNISVAVQQNAHPWNRSISLGIEKIFHFQPIQWKAR